MKGYIKFSSVPGREKAIECDCNLQLEGPEEKLMLLDTLVTALKFDFADKLIAALFLVDPSNHNAKDVMQKVDDGVFMDREFLDILRGCGKGEE